MTVQTKAAGPGPARRLAALTEDEYQRILARDTSTAASFAERDAPPAPPRDLQIIMEVVREPHESRAFGVRPGMRLAEAARRCPQAIFRRGDSQAANRLREQTARVLMDFSPEVEVASIDDFFVDLTADAHRARSAFDTAVAMRAAIRAATRLPVSGAQVLGPAGMRTSSDADGHFRLGDLAVGTQGEILVTGPDGARGRVPLLPLAPGPLEVVVHLQRP